MAWSCVLALVRVVRVRSRYMASPLILCVSADGETARPTRTRSRGRAALLEGGRTISHIALLACLVLCSGWCERPSLSPRIVIAEWRRCRLSS